MLIQVVANVSRNSYINNLINAYQKAGHEVICGIDNFFISNIIPDVIHIHWPELLIAGLSDVTPATEEEIIDRIGWYKKNKAIIVFTIHNSTPHDDNSYKSKLYQSIIALADILVHHCKRSIKLISEIYSIPKNIRQVVCPHGPYLDYYTKKNKSEIRKKYGIGENTAVLLVYGAQRSYKGPSFAKMVFSKISTRNKVLIIAGRPDKTPKNISLAKKIFGKILLKVNFFKKNIKTISRTIGQEMTAELFTISDIVFLPHKAGLNSGVIPMAATFNTPIVYPDIGCFKEQVESWAGCSYSPGDIKSAVSAINEIMLGGNFKGLSNYQWLEKNSWRKHTNTILKTIKDIDNR